MNVYLQNWAIKKCCEVFDIKTYPYVQCRYTIMGTIKLSWKFLSAIRVTTQFISSYFVLYYTTRVICNFKLYGNSQKRIYYCWLYRPLILIEFRWNEQIEDLMYTCAIRFIISSQMKYLVDWSYRFIIQTYDIFHSLLV